MTIKHERPTKQLFLQAQRQTTLCRKMHDNIFKKEEAADMQAGSQNWLA